MPKKAPEEPKPLSFATPNPWSALPRDVYVGKGRGKKEGATTESPLDGQDQPKIYTIRDHTLEVLMHPDVLELHAVRVVHTPHGDERQLHLKVRVRVSAANPHLLRFSQICPRLATFWSFSLLRRNRRLAAQSQDQTYIFLMCRI